MLWYKSLVDSPYKEQVIQNLDLSFVVSLSQLVDNSCDVMVMNDMFLYDQPRIRPWIRLISNKLDMTFRMHASLCIKHFLHHQQLIVTSLLECKPSDQDTGSICKNPGFYHHLCICYILQEIDNICSLVMNCSCPYLSVIWVFIALMGQVWDISSEYDGEKWLISPGQMTFSNAYSWKKILYCDANFTDIFLERPIDNKSALIQVMAWW